MPACKTHRVHMRRSSAVPLTKVKKKTREWKEGLIATVHECLEKCVRCGEPSRYRAVGHRYPSVYVFSYKNMRNERFKDLRDELRDTSRFVLGANKVLAVALGRSASDEPRDGTHVISQYIHGDVGLFFTSMPHGEVCAHCCNASCTMAPHRSSRCLRASRMLGTRGLGRKQPRAWRFQKVL